MAYFKLALGIVTWGTTGNLTAYWPLSSALLECKTVAEILLLITLLPLH